MGAADVEVVITFADLLAGRLGETERNAAEQLLKDRSTDSYVPYKPPITVAVEQGGYDMRVGNLPSSTSSGYAADMQPELLEPAVCGEGSLDRMTKPALYSACNSQEQPA